MDSELTVTLMKFGYLALLWVLVLACVLAIKSDVYGKVFKKNSSSLDIEKQSNSGERTLKYSRRFNGRYDCTVNCPEILLL